MRLVSVKRDGCLFRSLAVACSITCTGSIWEKDNFGARRPRQGKSPTMPCRGGCAPSSLPPWHPQRYAAHDVWPQTSWTRWTRPTRSRSISPAKASGPSPAPRVEGVLAPDIPRGLFRPEGGVSTVYKPENPQGHADLVGSVQRRVPPLAGACFGSANGVASPKFSRIFGVRIVVWGGHRVMVEYGDKTSMPVHVRLVEEHYDAYV